MDIPKGKIPLAHLAAGFILACCISCLNSTDWAFLRIPIDTRILQAMLLLYLLLALASLGVAIFSKADSQLRKQVNAWWLIFPIVSISLYLYPLGILTLALGISLLAARELAQHYQGKRWFFLGPCLLFLLLQTSLTLGGIPYFDQLLPWLLIAKTLHFFLHRQRNALLALLFLLLCYGLTFLQSLTQLVLAPEIKQSWLFYLFVITALNDIGQFVSGKCYGRHAIAPSISPNKTWQGLLGGMVLSMGVSVTLGTFLQLAGVGKLLALGLLLSVGGFFGDLLFSAAKRYLGIKDFSHLIPGHGGILDRVDSLVLTAPLLFLAL